MSHIDHLGLPRWRQLLYLACEDGRQHQQDGQVHREARLKVDGLEEGDVVHDHQQEQGEHVGDKHLRLDLTLHVHLLFAFVKPEVCDCRQTPAVSNPLLHCLCYSSADMIFVKKITRPLFWEQEFYAKNT